MELRWDPTLAGPPEGLAAEVTAIVADVVELEREVLWKTQDAHFVEDLEMDSMLIVEILADIEKRYRIEVPDEELPRLTSLRTLIQVIARRLEDTQDA